MKLKIIEIMFISFTVNKISLQNPRKLLMEPRDSVGHSLKAILQMVAMASLEASPYLPAVIFLPALSGQCQPTEGACG
jgi:hypothetical protein